MAPMIDRSSHWNPARVNLFAVISAAVLRAGHAQVDCGGHIQDTCSNCQVDQESGMDYGEAWCHGECKWIDPHWFGFSGRCLSADISEDTGGLLGEYGFSFSVSAIVMLLFACVYKRKVVDHLPQLKPHLGTDLAPREKSICACYQAPETCIYSFCCLPLVAGKNYHAADICNFWPGCIFTFLGTYTPFFVVAVMIRAALSGRVREKLGYKPHLCTDCCCSLFCFPCEVARESMEIDEELGVRVGCCYPHLEVDPREEEKIAAPLQLAEEMTGQDAKDGRMCSGWGYTGH